MNSPQGSSPESENHPEDGQQSVRKRKRKTFSCDACRKRKLRCDRIYPVCGRCQKAGSGATCVYETVPEITNKAPTPSRSAQIAEVDYRGPLYLTATSGYDSPQMRPTYVALNPQADRLAALENRIAAIDPLIAPNEYPRKRPRLDDAGLSSTLDSAFEKTVSSGDANSAFFYGSGFRTGYFGPSSQRNGASYNSSILAMFPEFKVFLLGSSLQSPAFVQLRADAGKIRKNAKMAKKLLPFPPPLTLFDAVPDKETCSRLVHLYWDTVANTFHIIHRPTFWNAFWSYWAEPLKRNESFACTILLMISIVNCMDRSQPRRYRGLSSIAREEASYWIEACESFTSRQSRKHLTAESFQHRILLYLAKQANHLKTKEAWERAQALFAFAISTGLHQDTTRPAPPVGHNANNSVAATQRTTPYEREMRRRFWAAIVEIEIQASLDKGVPFQRISLTASCGRPSLISDDQFDETSTSLPAPELRDKFLPVSYLNLSQESLQLRASLSDLVNIEVDNITYEEVLSNDDRIKRAIADLPGWVHSRNNNTTASSSIASCTSAALLELQLRQFQLILHHPFARRPENDSRYNLSRMTAIDVAVRMVRIHRQLALSSATRDPGTHGRKPGNHSLNLIREDAFRAVMAICNNLVIWRGVNSDLSAQGMKEIYNEPALHAVELLEDKVLTVGEHYAQLWFARAALGMARCAFAPKELDIHVQGVAEALTTLFGKVVVAQEEPSNEQTAAGALTEMATPNSIGYDSSTALPLPDLANTQSYVDGGIDMNVWGFEELWPFTSTGLSW